MELIKIDKNNIYLKEYLELCTKEWGHYNSEEEFKSKINNKINKINNGTNDQIITVIGLIDNNILLGFISLFNYDGNEEKNLTPWYATMYVKKEYRGNNYSKILNTAILKEAKRLGYKRLYLKTDLTNYYEKFNAKFIKKLSNGESLYYIKL